MLLYLKLSGEGVDAGTLSFDVEPECTIDDFKTRVCAKFGIEIQRIIFGGQILTGSRTIVSFNVAKEAVVHIFCKKSEAAATQAAPKSPKAATATRSGRDARDRDSKRQRSNSPANRRSAQAPTIDEDIAPPSLTRQSTAPDVKFGDALIVKVVGARNLMPVSFVSFMRTLLSCFVVLVHVN